MVPLDTDVEIHTDVNLTLHDVVESSVVDSAGSNANEIGWKNTRAKETFGADSENVSV